MSKSWLAWMVFAAGALHPACAPDFVDEDDNTGAVTGGKGGGAGTGGRGTGGTGGTAGRGGAVPGVAGALTITPTLITVARGKTTQLTATWRKGTNGQDVQDLTAEVEWSVDDKTVASVNTTGKQPGLVTGLKAGATVVRATYQSLTAETLVKVRESAVMSVTLTPATAMLMSGGEQRFGATAHYADGTNIAVTEQAGWATADAAVAAVSNAVGARGFVTAAAPGSTTVSATFGGIAGTATLSVVTASTVVVLSPTESSRLVGETETFTLTTTTAAGAMQNLTNSAQWLSFAPAVATISGPGRAVCRSVGTAVIRASLRGTGAMVQMVCVDPTILAVRLTPAMASLNAGVRIQLYATAYYGNNTTRDVTASADWSSSNSDVATVTNAAGMQMMMVTRGTVTAVAAGMADISASYASTTGKATITVTGMAN